MIGEFRMRVTFGLTGRLVMLSHLELARAIERMVRRAQLPYAVSQGFSPHMKLSFGAALPVGVGGVAEIFDVFLTDYIEAGLALKMLQAVAPPDCFPTEVQYVDPKDPAASDAFPCSTYHVIFSEPCKLAVPERIVVVRKKKERELIPEDFIRDILFESENMYVTLEAKKTGSLRIDVLLAHMLEEHNKDDRSVYPTSIMRIAQQACEESQDLAGEPL